MRAPRKWLRPALNACDGDVAKMRFLVRHRSRIDALLKLELRDRWGYKLEPMKLAEIADNVVRIQDQDADGLILTMLVGDLPLVCEGSDTPLGDELAELIIQTVKSATTT